MIKPILTPDLVVVDESLEGLQFTRDWPLPARVFIPDGALHQTQGGARLAAPNQRLSTPKARQWAGEWGRAKDIVHTCTVPLTSSFHPPLHQTSKKAFKEGSLRYERASALQCRGKKAL